MRCSIPRPMHTQTRRQMQWDAWTTSPHLRPRRWIRPEQLHQHLPGVGRARLRRFWCVAGPSTSFPSSHDPAHARRASSILSQAMRCASPPSSTSSSSLSREEAWPSTIQGVSSPMEVVVVKRLCCTTKEDATCMERCGSNAGYDASRRHGGVQLELWVHELRGRNSIFVPTRLRAQLWSELPKTSTNFGPCHRSRV